jgi:hypothetical protein
MYNFKIKCKKHLQKEYNKHTAVFLAVATASDVSIQPIFSIFMADTLKTDGSISLQKSVYHY